MKFLEKFLYNLEEKYFAEGKKLERWHPLFDAADTLFFSPKAPPKEGPHIRDSLNHKRFMGIVVFALFPAALFGIYNTGLQALGGSAATVSISFTLLFLKGLLIFLPIVILSYVVGLFWEILFSIVRKHPVSEGYFVSGLLIALILPPTIPYWMMAVGISFGVVLGKEVFGGSGMNIINPALTVRVFLYFAYPGAMSGDKVWIAKSSFLAFLEKPFGIPEAVAAVSGATPLALAPLAKSGSLIDSAGTFAHSAFAGSFSLSNLIIGTYPGSIGETSVIACLIGGFILLVTKIASWRSIAATVVGALATGYLLQAFGTTPYSQMPPMYHLIIGGFAFGLFFMVADPVTAPSSSTAKYIYGFMIGFLTIIIRVVNPAYPEGMMLAILFMNIFAPIIDYIVVSSRIRRRLKYAQ